MLLLQHVKKKTVNQNTFVFWTKNKNTNLRPDDGLEDGVELIRSEAVRVKAFKEVLDPQDAEAPQVLQRVDAPCTQLSKRQQGANQNTAPSECGTDHFHLVSCVLRIS